MELQTAARYRLLDELRGLDLISMMLYHGMWDVVFLFGVARSGTPDARALCGSRASAGSSSCFPASACRWGIIRSGGGTVVFGAGALVTAVTLLFLPEDVVWFGGC